MNGILAELIAATISETTISYNRESGTFNEKVSVKGHPASLMAGMHYLAISVLQNVHLGDKEKQKESMRLLCKKVCEEIDKGDGNGGM